MVEDGSVVGLGTGSTAVFFIDALAARVRGGLKIVGIPTSERSAAQARAGGIEIVTFATHQVIDIAIDGADEITRSGLDLTKGLGGALLREKMVAGAARRLVIIADEGKMVDRLGELCPIPVAGDAVRVGVDVQKADGSWGAGGASFGGREAVFDGWGQLYPRLPVCADR